MIELGEAEDVAAEQPQWVSCSQRNFRRRTLPPASITAAPATITNDTVCCQSMLPTYALNPPVQPFISWGIWPFLGISKTISVRSSGGQSAGHSPFSSYLAKLDSNCDDDDERSSYPVAAPAAPRRPAEIGRLEIPRRGGILSLRRG